MNMKFYVLQAGLVCALPPLFGCENPVKRAVRNISYSGYEMIGLQKRDLLKRDIASARRSQNDASETFKSALDNLRTLYSLPSTQLERQYRVVNASFERSDAKAHEVRAGREKMQTVARDLFREWQGEIGEIHTAELQKISRERLRESQAKFARMDQSLERAERRMGPVLIKLKDHVLFLKHNLNAESLSALKPERDRIEHEITNLIGEMDQSVRQSEEFIRTLR